MSETQEELLDKSNDIALHATTNASDTRADHKRTVAPRRNYGPNTPSLGIEPRDKSGDIQQVFLLHSIEANTDQKANR